MTMDTVAERLDRHAMPEPNSGCWLWTACCNERGYGRLTVGGKGMAAHRLSFMVHRGEIPEGMLVCHRCDNPSCINPDHLFLGTSQDNALDCSAKGRHFYQLHPEASRSSKLTLDDVRYIRLTYRPGLRPTRRDLAKQFQVSISAIAQLLSRRTYGAVA